MYRGFAKMLLALVLIAYSGTAWAEVTLRFGIYAAENPTAIVKKVRPVLKALESTLSELLGEPVRIRTKVSGSYEAGIEELVRGDVDFARFGPASYIAAKDSNPAIELLAMENNKGQKTFNGIIAVHQDSDFQTVEDLRDRTFAFGNERSTIGRYLSQLYLMEHGLHAADLGRFEYLGRHDLVGMAVALKRFEAGALKESAFKKLVAAGQPLRAIAEFPNVTMPWIARAELPRNLFDALRTALLKMRDPAALKAIKKDGFLEGTDADYNVIRQAIMRSAEFGGDRSPSTAMSQ